MAKKTELPIAKSDIHKYTKFICVDEQHRPMSWDGTQLCYSTSSHWQDTHWPIQIYSRRRAWDLIQRTIKYRKKNKWPIQDYRVMPIVVSGSDVSEGAAVASGGVGEANMCAVCTCGNEFRMIKNGICVDCLKPVNCG